MLMHRAAVLILDIGKAACPTCRGIADSCIRNSEANLRDTIAYSIVNNIRDRRDEVKLFAVTDID